MGKLPGDDSENQSGRGEGGGEVKKVKRDGKKKKIILDASVRAV